MTSRILIIGKANTISQQLAALWPLGRVPAYRNINSNGGQTSQHSPALQLSGMDLSIDLVNGKRRCSAVASASSVEAGAHHSPSLNARAYAVTCANIGGRHVDARVTSASQAAEHPTSAADRGERT